MTAVSTGTPVTILLERWSDLAQTLIRRPRPDSLILRERNLLGLSTLRVLDLDLDRANLIIEPALLLRLLRLLVTPCSKLILCLSANVKVGADVLGRLAHGLQAVLCFALEQLFAEVKPLACGGRGHAFTADGEADVDAAKVDLVGNVLHGFEAGGAEAVDGGGSGGVGEAGSEGGGANVVGGARVVDLGSVRGG